MASSLASPSSLILGAPLLGWGAFSFFFMPRTQHCNISLMKNFFKKIII